MLVKVAERGESGEQQDLGRVVVLWKLTQGADGWRWRGL